MHDDFWYLFLQTGDIKAYLTYKMLAQYSDEICEEGEKQ